MRADARESAETGQSEEGEVSPEQGAAGEALQLSDRTGGDGARVERVLPASPASSLIRPGDVVVAADGRPVRSAEALDAYLGSLPQGAPVLLEIVRGGRTRYVGVQVTPPPPRKAPAPPPPQAAAPAPAPVIIIQGGTAPAPVTAPPVVVLGGGFDPWPAPWLAPRPPAFAAPGLPQTPGATFAPAPGTSAYAYPQIPGVAQPPGFLVPLRGPGR
jgi:hypothetical protein